MAYKKYRKNRLELSHLEHSDGKYNVGNLVVLDWSWVDKSAAEEILDIINAEYDAFCDMALEMIDKRRQEETE
jgi:hypothetical protein